MIGFNNQNQSKEPDQFDDPKKIDEIMEQVLTIIPHYRGLLPKLLTIRRAQLLLDWLKAGNEDQRKKEGIEVGGKYFMESEKLEKEAGLRYSGVKYCRVCLCTDKDCRQCIEKTGQPCFWISDNLCSACSPEIVNS